MSVRAHLITKLEYTGEIFNLWHDEDLVNMLEKIGLLKQLDDDFCGILEINRETIQTLINEAEKHIQEGESLEWVENFKQILKEYPEREYFLFYCF